MGLDEVRKLKAEAGIPKKKEYHRIPPISKKRQEKLALERKERGGEDTDLVKWYKANQKFLTGYCMRCGAKYNPSILKNAIAATAHILAKRDCMFPSVKTHPLNRLELNPYCGCHHWYDNQATWEEIKASNLWPIIVERFMHIEPHILEREKIPALLLAEIKHPFNAEEKSNS